RSELLHTSSANWSVICAGVLRTGRISYSVTCTPCLAICQAASLPARPAPMTVTLFIEVKAFPSQVVTEKTAPIRPPSSEILLSGATYRPVSIIRFCLLHFFLVPALRAQEVGTGFGRLLKQ